MRPRMPEDPDDTRSTPTPELMRLTLEHLEEIVYAVRFEGDDYHRGEATYVSPRVFDLVGFTTDEFVKDPTLWFSRIHPEDLLSVRNSTRAILSSRRSGLRTYRVRHRQGDYRWFEDRVVPQLDERGRVIGVFGLARDVTERHISAQQLEETENRLRQLIESIPDGLIVIDADSQIVLVNRHAEQLFGYLRDEMIGLPVERSAAVGEELAGERRRTVRCRFDFEQVGAEIAVTGSIQQGAASWQLIRRSRSDRRWRDGALDAGRRRSHHRHQRRHADRR